MEEAAAACAGGSEARATAEGGALCMAGPLLRGPALVSWRGSCRLCGLGGLGRDTPRWLPKADASSGRADRARLEGVCVEEGVWHEGLNGRCPLATPRPPPTWEAPRAAG